MSEPYLDPFSVLGLERNAAPDAIKRAYFALVRENPPERAPEAFKRIRAAYERLRDPAKRVQTEMELIQPWPAPTRRRRAPKLELQVGPADVLAALRALSELDRTDWRDAFEKVKL